MNHHQYIPLRLHSEFSIEEGIVRLPEAVHFAQKQGLPALALSDLMNLFGIVKFYRTCRQNGIKPILGVDIVLEDTQRNLCGRLLLLAKNQQGYRTICEWLTHAYLAEEHQQQSACLSYSWLLQQNTDGLICLSGAQEGLIGKALLRGDMAEAEVLTQEMNALFPDSFYLEIQRFHAHIETDESLKKAFQTLENNAQTVLSGSLNLAQKWNIPPVATHPVQFMQAEDFTAHEARVCIHAGEVLADTRRARCFHPSQYFLDHDAMCTLFADIPEALSNSVEIAKRCNVEIELGKNYLPIFPTPDGMTLDEHLRTESEQGLAVRMEQLFPDEAMRQAQYPHYAERLHSELNTIISMGFPGYFLIVADFINWAKNNGCPVGPGRGSGAGSLVAYALKITDLDPIRYALLFERFLNPERVSMPDFDIDFCQDNRHRVIDYVRHKYGENAVSQIITFNTMSSKAVVRDVGRVLQLPFGLCDKLSKLIPLEANKPLSLAKAMETEPQIGKILAEEEADDLITLAQKLEDLTRGVGMHAGGVLIAPGKLSDFCPVYCAEGADSASVSMYDKDDVEAVGLVKFDFLGLRNLTVIRMAEAFIQSSLNQQIDVNQVPLDDTATYAHIFATGNTTAVFQFESSGMRRMLQEAKPSKFEEIIAFVALYRPGPMELIPDFISRMHGKKFEYLHPLLEGILAPTYGIMVYQEQVMQTAQICAGYTLGQADMLRRAMGKKKPEEMEKQRTFFVEGAAQKNIDATKANEIFDYMEKFAGYGFNKSHAAAYALLAYQTAWLKQHYPAQFIAATMSCDLNNTDQLKIFYDDAQANGIHFLPPDINHPQYHFVPEGKNGIRYALGAIKGTGEAAIESIMSAHAKAPFADLLDFCTRVGKISLNKRTLEALIRAGAFDSIDPNRAALMEYIEPVMKFAEQQNENQHQAGLFDIEESTQDISHILAPVAEWNLSHKLAEEKSAMGFYFSAHPFSPYESEVRTIAKTPLADIQAYKDPQWLGGFITQVRSIITKKNKKKIWILLLEDTTGKVEVTIPETMREENQLNLQVDRVMLLECAVKKDEFNGGNGLRIHAEKAVYIEDARSTFARSLHLFLNENSNIDAITALLKQHQNPEKHTIPISIRYQSKHASGSLNATHNWRINPDETLISALKNLLGTNNCRVRW